MLTKKENKTLSQRSAWNYNVAFLAIVGAIAAGVTWYLISNLLSDVRDANQLMGLDDAPNIDSVTTVATVPTHVNDHHGVAVSTDITTRGTLSTTIEVAHPIPSPQMIDASAPWIYPLGDVFSGDVAGIGMDASDNDPQSDWLQVDPIIGTQEIPNTAAYGIKVVGDTAYVADSEGFKTFKMPEPGKFILSSAFDIPFGARGPVAVSDGRAYIPDPYTKTYIFNVTGNATLLGVCDAVQVFDFVVRNKTGYIAQGFSGFSIMDYSNPANCAELGYQFRFGITSGVALSGNGQTAYTTHTSGLYAMDVRDPANIMDLANAAAPDGGVDKMVVDSGIIFACGSGGLAFYDETDLSLMSVYLDPDYPYFADLRVRGSLVYVISTYGIDVIKGGPSHPALMFRYPVFVNAYGLDADNKYIYLTNGNVGLQTLDPSKPKLTGTPTAARSGERYQISIHAWNSQGDVTTAPKTTLVVNQPVIPTDKNLNDISLLPGEERTINTAMRDLFSSDGYLKIDVLANGQKAPWLTAQLKPTLRGSLNRPTAFDTSLQIVGKTAYIPVGNEGVLLANIASPDRLKLTVFYNESAPALDMSVFGSRGYTIPFDTKLSVLNLTDPQKPQLLSNTDIVSSPDYVNVVAAAPDNIVYAGVPPTKLLILKATTPVPVVLKTINVPGEVSAMERRDNKLHVTYRFGGLDIFDATNSADLSPLGHYSISGLVRILKVSGSNVYIAQDAKVFKINAADPSNPVLESSYDTGGSVNNLDAVGDTVFVADEYLGMLVVDFSGQAPVVVASYKGPGAAHAVKVDGDIAYVTDNKAGLQAIDLSPVQIVLNPQTPGNSRITVVATNAAGEQGSRSFGLRAEGPPIIDGTISDQFMIKGKPYRFLPPQGMVSDPNNDVIFFEMKVVDGTWPVGFTFNRATGEITGTPESAFEARIEITATDGITTPTADSTTQFNLISRYPLQISEPITEPPVWREEKAFEYSIPATTIANLNGNPLTYTISLEGNLKWPTWLKFNSDTLTLNGTPPSDAVGSLPFVLTATDPIVGESISLRFESTVEPNYAPQLTLPIDPQTMNLRGKFSLSLQNSFNDPNRADEKLLFRVRMTKPKDRKPSWLSITENGVLTAQPSKNIWSKDNPFWDKHFGSRFFDVTVTASDGNLSADARFLLQVSGFNFLAWVVTIGAPLVAVLGIFASCYAARKICENPWKNRDYKKLPPVELPEIGGFIIFDCDPKEIADVQVKIAKRKPKSCFSRSIAFFQSSRRPYPGGTPPWLQWCPDRNGYEVIGDPGGDRGSTLTFQAKDSAGILLDKIRLRIPSFQDLDIDHENNAAGVGLSPLTPGSG